MRFIYPIVFILFFLGLTAFVFNAPEILSPDPHGLEAGTHLAINGELPMGFNDLFAGSGECELCHSSMVNAQGESVSIINDWRSTMMANAAVDPFWRAKVSHETLVNPEHAEVLEDVCTRCHAPMGHFNAHYNGQSLYSIENMEADPLALDGVSCTVCHQITEESLGNFSGEILFGEDKTIWGPYVDPFPNPMINHTGYTPEYSPHIKDSRVCASCHTLITNTVDLDGNLTGTQFVEQAIYHEWLNSTYSTGGTSCQTCHIPEISDEVVISTMPPWLEGRTPFGLHHLVGANVFMLRLLRDNIDILGINATVDQFENTIDRATQKLQSQAVMLSIEEDIRTQDSLFISVSLQNIAGHKLPGGYPSRRVFVSIEVNDAGGQTLFHSGIMDEEFNLIQEDEGYEPHHKVINEPEMVQIYELVMGNVELEPTTVLEQAYVALKDNRLPPVGFTSSHMSYDTVKIMGAALQDADFNGSGGTEGSGKDILHYHIPTNGNTSELSITCKVYYQTVSNRWLQEMFEYSSDEIDAFKGYYEAADKTPVLIAEKNMVSLFSSVDIYNDHQIFVSPNPAGQFIHLHGIADIQNVRLYNFNGSLLSSPEVEFCNADCLKIKTPEQRGGVIVRFTDGEGQLHSQKVILK